MLSGLFKKTPLRQYSKSYVRRNFGTMYVPTMSITEAIAEAKADLRSVQNKMLSNIKALSRQQRTNRREGGLREVHSYTSPRRNNWMYAITVTKKNSVHNVMMWFQAPEGLTGLQLSHQGHHFVYTPHFFTRYRERSGTGAPGAVDNLQAYFSRNPAAMAMRTGKEHLGLPAIIGAVPDGFVLGTLDERAGYHLCRTYIHHDQAFANQAADWDGLNALLTLQLHHPALFAQLRPGYLDAPKNQVRS